MRRSRQSRGEWSLKRLTAAVRAARVKLTPQRIEVFRALARTEEHPDADALFRAVRRRAPTVSLDTVYRTLRMLHGHGLVATLGAGRDGLRFDANLDRHHHYVCVRCGLVRDFLSTEFDALRAPEAARRFGSVVATQVEVRGLCASCQRTRTPKPPAHHARPQSNRRSRP